MVLLWHHSEEPFSGPDGTFMVMCAGIQYNEVEKFCKKGVHTKYPSRWFRGNKDV